MNTTDRWHAVVPRLGLSIAVILALASLPLNGCRPTPAGAATVGGEMVLAAVGDTIKATARWRTTGSPDSVRTLFTAGNAPSRVITKLAPPNAVQWSVGPALLIPNPPLAEGATTTVSACPVVWKAGASFPGACLTKPFTNPVTVPTITGDSLDVVGLDLYPRGTYALTRASGACLRAYRASTDPTGWVPVWDAATADWKPICKGANGLPMVAAYCAAIVMGDSMRVLNAQWTTRPWCSRYTAQVPRRYVMPPGLTTKRQIAADRAVVQFSARTAAGVPMPGFSWDEPFGMTVVRDTVTPDAAMSNYAVGFLLSRSPPGRGGLTSPDSTLTAYWRLYTSAGVPRAGVPVTWGTPCCGGQLSAAPGENRWKQYGAAGS